MSADIVGWGTPESAWQAWGGLAALSRQDPAALVGPGRRVVVVAPHPDDELLGAGGILAQLPADRPILIVAVTDGEGSHPGSQTWTPERLRAVRPVETANALQALNISAQVMRLQIADGGVGAAEQALTETLTSVIGPRDVVITTWRGDGHPDHEAVGRAVAVAGDRAGALRWEMPIWAWHWAEPGDPRVPWEKAVRFDLPEGVLARKRAAVGQYASQLAEDPVTELGCILPEPVLARLLRPFEVLFRT